MTQLQKTPKRPFARPTLDIFESADQFLVVADLPGVAADQLELSLEEGELTLVGHRAAPPEGRKPLHGQWADHDYRVTLRVPPDIDGEGVSAKMDDGVLEVSLPKAAAIKARQIPVTAG